MPGSVAELAGRRLDLEVGWGRPGKDFLPAFLVCSARSWIGEEERGSLGRMTCGMVIVQLVVALLIFFFLFPMDFEATLGLFAGVGWLGTGDGWSQSVILALARRPCLLAFRTFLGVARDGSSFLSPVFEVGLGLGEDLLGKSIELLPGSGPWSFPSLLAILLVEGRGSQSVVACLFPLPLTSLL